MRTWSGFIYVAFVTDAYSRRIVGPQALKSLRSDLAINALERAIWYRNRTGDSLNGLIHHSDRGTLGGFKWFRQAGGMPPLSVGPTSGRYRSFEEREEIAILHAQGAGVRAIAPELGRSPSTVSRELRRNAWTRSNELAYRSSTAQWHAERRASRPKVSKLTANGRLRDYVADRLAGQIARPDGEAVAGPEVPFVGRRHGRRADRRWAKS